MSKFIRSVTFRLKLGVAYVAVLSSAYPSDFAHAATHAPESPAGQNASAGAEPWTPADVIEPEQLVKQLSDPNATRPEILYVGPPALYKTSHIPQAQLIGLTSRPEGLNNLAKATQGAAKDREIIIYCGCCPWNVCPNIRPAFTALRERGFTKVRVLRLPSTFAQDWVKRGFPIEKAS